MNIRSHLWILVVAAAAPLVVLVAVTTDYLWELERRAYTGRILERVNALRLALDTELQAMAQALQMGAVGLEGRFPGDSPSLLAARLESLRGAHPNWTGVGLTRPDGAPIAWSGGRGGQALRLDPATAKAVRDTRRPAYSDLVALDDGRSHLTFVAAPVLRDGEVRAIAYAAIEPAAWLAFLQRYPIAEGAVLTLNDRDAYIIARTLRSEQWVGKRSSAAFWDQTIGRDSGSFVSPGLDGERFYAGFSRSRQAAWVVGTGVPREVVEAAVRGPTFAIAGGALAALLLAATLAWFLAGRISRVLTRLAEEARHVAEAQAPPAPAAQDHGTLPITEVETVREALKETSSRLRLREQSLQEALGRESHARAEAERASKAKDELLAMLGHELRNPLGAMSNAVTLLVALEAPEGKEAGRQAGAAPAPAQRAREILQRQLRHLSRIINDLLDVARLTSGKVVLNRALLDCAEVCRHVLDSFRASGRAAHVRLRQSLAQAPVYADETRLEQVVSNLLDNAFKYTPAGGEVEVTLRAVGAQVILTVRDTGPGISAELLPQVFDVFSQGQRTVDRAQGGMGLGLTVVRRLVNLHGGMVEVRSDGVDRGSTFTVTLPRAAGSTATGSASPIAAEKQHRLAPQRIVVVEDNADNRESVTGVLRLQGHAVTAVADGTQGLAALLEGDADIALVDLGLPGMDGIELARRVRAAGKPLLLIALTGYGRAEDRAKAMAAGFDAFLLKPFQISQFERAVGFAAART